MKNIKSNKGITLLAISVLVVVMLMVTSAIVFRTMTMYKLKALNDMNNDLKMLEENISVYYSKYNSIPILDGNVFDKIEEIYSNPDVITDKNSEDNDNYYVIDLTALENISITNGKDFETFRSGDTTVSDIYVMNEKTHTVYYIAGVLLDGKLYHTLETDYASINNIPQIANPPLLTGGMIPIKHNGTGWVITTETDLDWYSYDTSNKKWANVMLSDGRYDSTAVSGTVVAESELGSMYVWIPRYAYKITSGYHTSTAGTIDIKFLNGTTNQSRTQSIKVAKPDENNEINPYPTDYIQHSAFTFGEDELEGIWVAKFESSIYKVADNTNLVQPATGGTVVTDIDAYYIKSLPDKSSWRYTSISNIFKKTIDMKNESRYKLKNADTHLMKNTELGAVAYLSNSTYGINAEMYINNNNAYKTGQAGSAVNTSSSATTNAYGTTNGLKASNTGNIYGIYDLNGGAYEYVAAYVDNANAIIGTNGEHLKNAPNKYKDIYIKPDTESQANNYGQTIRRIGDAIYETSSTGISTSNSWYSDAGQFPYTATPFITRTGYMGDTASSGIFSYKTSNGAAVNTTGFRTTIVNLNSRVGYNVEINKEGQIPPLDIPEIKESEIVSRRKLDWKCYRSNRNSMVRLRK